MRQRAQVAWASSAVLAATFVACGGSTERTSPIVLGTALDAAAPQLDAGPPPAKQPVRIIKVTPEDAALHVAPTTKVTLLLSGQADPASVTASSVMLYAPYATAPLPATVTYDASTTTITLTPAVPLGMRDCMPLEPVHSDDVYRVATSALRAADGTPIDDVTTRFTILHHAFTGSTMYTGGSLLSPTSDATYMSTTLDAEGRMTRVVTWSSGPDRVPHTADDVVERHQDWTYSATGVLGVDY